MRWINNGNWMKYALTIHVRPIIVVVVFVEHDAGGISNVYLSIGLKKDQTKIGLFVYPRCRSYSKHMQW